MKVRLRRSEGAPIVAVRLLFSGGARVESHPGQALLAGRLLTEGTLRRGWEQIAADAEGRGAILTSFGGYEAHGLAIDALAADWERALDWAAELALESTFPEDRLRWLARQAVAELESQADQADLVTARAFAEQLYAPHPRGRALQGDAASLEALDSARCRAFHESARRWGMTLSIAGVFPEEAVAQRIGELFPGQSESGILETPAGEMPTPPVPAAAPSPRVELFTRAEDQAHLFLGARTVSRGHPDYTALELAAVLLGTGSGLTGRIPQRIREREGLAYAATADTVAGAGLDEGRLSCYVGTAPETLDQAESAVRDELVRFVSEPIPAEEFESARSYLVGREPFRRETARQWADLMAVSALYELPLDDPAERLESLEGITAEAVEAAVRRWIDPERLLVTRGLPTSRASSLRRGSATR